MAVSLKGDDFGRLVDPFHGRRDLEAKTIRVLHNLSFIDDPTRIFRAIRYESRYGFRMDEHTQRLARGTIEMGLVGDLSSARPRRADRPARGGRRRRVDPSPGRARSGPAIHPHLAADEEAVPLERLRELNERYGTGIPAWRLALEALARKLPPDEIYEWLQRLKVQRRDAERIAWRSLSARGWSSASVATRRSRRRSSRSQSPRRRTRRSTRSRWPTRSPCASTSSGFET